MLLVGFHCNACETGSFPTTTGGVVCTGCGAWLGYYAGPVIYSTVGNEPLFPSLVDARTEAGKKLLLDRFSKQGRMKQTRREQAKLLRRKR